MRDLSLGCHGLGQGIEVQRSRFRPLRFERNGHESGALVAGRTGVRLGITIVARVVIEEDEATISRG